ncbi:unnamed protein product, partial [Meganyctiphanes norvegica]
HSRSVTQWDHPEYVRVMEEVQAANSVKYAAYRTACKLRRLQTRLKLQDVNLQCIASAFDSAGLRVGENSDLVGIKQIEAVVNQVLRTSHKHRPVDTNLATELTINLILNVLDEARSGVVQVLGCKVIMVVLCSGRLQEKYRYLFTQLADHNNCCTRRRLAMLLRELARIPELLSEKPSFGISFVSAAVDSCFKDIIGDVGVTEEVLLSWLLQEPQTLVWWTTLYRLTAAELVCHDVKCGVCKQRPIIGLRYQCLRCIGYNLCQDCFLHARISRKHKLTHPIQEYCHETSGKEWRKAVMKIMKHRLRRTDGNKQRYLAIPTNGGPNLTSLLYDGGGNGSPGWSGSSGDDDTEEEEELMSRTILHPDDDNDEGDGVEKPGEDDNSNGAKAKSSQQHCAEPTIIRTSPRHQIHSVIMHLEEGHRQLEEAADSTKAVEQHTQQLQTQINRLKSILQSYSSTRGSRRSRRGKREGREPGEGLPRMESTPIVGDRGLWLNISPIVTMPHPSGDDTVILDNKENQRLENPDATPKRSDRSVMGPPRIPFSQRTANHLSHSSTPNNKKTQSETNEFAIPKSVPKPARLPSFTEVNFSDLTCLSSATASSAPTPAPAAKLEATNSYAETVANDSHDTATDVREELENILQQLDQIFPMKDQQRPVASADGVVEAACELGDVLAEYVSAVPHS